MMRLSLRHSAANLVLFVTSLIFLLPTLIIVNIGLKSNQEFLKYPVKLVESVHWVNFSKAWKQADMSTYYTNSIIYAVGAAALTCIIAAIAAFPLARRHVQGANFILGLIALTLFLPDGIVPTLFLMKKIGFMNTTYGFILLETGLSLSLAVFILNGFIRSIPIELDEAANMDGCGYFRYVFTIVMPMMKSALATVFMLKMITVWNDFINPYMYLTDKDKRPLTSGLYMFIGEFSTDWTVMAAGIVIVALPLILVYIFMQRFIISGLSSGAVKG
ncbi:carbohydrate ABC transporter permease [Paenibacillus roseipurpureus]|uniref:Carbohydrate ABC transporter permease n=1 Tax=Paenibacillus roseopurpureus TaxID=2918901 RepID=A0AA96LQZ7_9BACL|nr:carbohydrate ABC transporter permease [Paenibacillus sp. MBLB1832]WNR45683.1 carbohydrate ABC transporter permease [Paenibacillus sp. MBLB1832]